MKDTFLNRDATSVYAVILAGGYGERFWPLSRKAKPKHHLALFSERTLLSATVDRLDGFVPFERILVLTGIDQADAVRALLPELPHENFIVEPLRRDTAAAMALAAGAIARRDPHATVVVLPADHHIPNAFDFQTSLRAAVHAAERNASIVTVAIKPDWACPGFGYLELGGPLEHDGHHVKPVVRFHEKPSAEKASEYLAQGNFRWNAGMFVWTVPVLQEALRSTAPELSVFCEGFQNSSDPHEFLAAKFASVPKISFDYAVMEKLSGVLAVEAGFDWDDLGGWAAAGKYFPMDAHGNAGNAPILSVDASNNIVFSKDAAQHVALLGVENLIVVNTGDALLVCPRAQAERLKELVAALPAALQ
jgi:mannose-1-phosphate guanylyltransferase